MKRTIILPAAEAHKILRRFLGAREPGLIRSALQLWRAQAGMIDKRDVESFISGMSPVGLLYAWTQMNQDFVREKIVPQQIDALESSSADMTARLRKLQRKAGAFTTQEIQKWVTIHAAELVVEINLETTRVLNSILRTYVIEKPMSAYQISKMVENHVGLTARYSRAVVKRYDDMIAMGASPAKAMKEMERYSQFLKRSRAMTIARNELAEAYGEGQLQAMRNAFRDGLVDGQPKKSWATADDERTCPICQALDGETVDLEASFSNGRMRNPAHIQCRCAVQYEVISNA
jgi:SPP1 gp7 family putative phage head morphogenesis protein